MAHLRKAIRDAVVARLIGAVTVDDVTSYATAAGIRVFANRAKPLFDAELPAILVYTKNEPAEISIESPREYKRNLNVSLELVASGTSEASVDDALDDLAEQVETAMFSEETFGGLVTDTILGDTEMELMREGEKPVGAAKITFSMPYFQQLPGDLTEDLDAFERMGTTVETPEEATVEGLDELEQDE